LNSSVKNIRILVVDDSELILKAFQNFFINDRVDVLTCTDGLKGLEKATREKPDIIFLDLLMPNLNGIKMLREKQEIDAIKNIPVVVVSANTARTNVLAAIDAGAAKVISKPLQKDIIVETLNEILGVDLNLNYLTSNRNNQSILIQEEYYSDLVNIFLRTFNDKKEELLSSVRTKDKYLLRSVAHDLKGAGATINNEIIKNAASEIENIEITNPGNWVFIETKINEIFSEVNKLKEKRIKK